MKSKRTSSTTQPLMASALLAVALVVTTSRERGIYERPVHLSAGVADADSFASTHRLARWQQGLNQFVDRQLIRCFHCALPSGLEPHDLDLGDLNRKERIVNGEL
jgi:hypothetical protein